MAAPNAGPNINPIELLRSFSKMVEPVDDSTDLVIWMKVATRKANSMGVNLAANAGSFFVLNTLLELVAAPGSNIKTIVDAEFARDDDSNSLLDVIQQKTLIGSGLLSKCKCPGSDHAGVDIQAAKLAYLHEIDLLKMHMTIGQKCKEEDQNKLIAYVKKSVPEIQIEVLSETINICGWDLEVSKASALVMEFLLVNRPTGIDIPIPPNWEKQTEKLQLFDITDKGGNEWYLVEKRLHETCPNVKIVKLQRVQQKALWDSYQTKKKYFENKLESRGTKDPIELKLFHGTSSLNPEAIYKDEQGFDMRFCTQGMWGIGLYFAVNASYSYGGYCYQVNGQKQMFLVRVCVGDAIHIMPPDRSLRRPPAQSTGSPVIEYYDSVSGETGGSKVYIIYENWRAYPEYLLTLEDK